MKAHRSESATLKVSSQKNPKDEVNDEFFRCYCASTKTNVLSKNMYRSTTSKKKPDC